MYRLVYLSGQITGLHPEEAAKRFAAAEDEFDWDTYTVINPMRLVTMLERQAVLEGRKTQTRRTISPQPYYDENEGMARKGYTNGRGLHASKEPQASRNFVHNAPMKVGEIVPSHIDSYNERMTTFLMSEVSRFAMM